MWVAAENSLYVYIYIYINCCINWFSWHHHFISELLIVWWLMCLCWSQFLIKHYLNVSLNLHISQMIPHLVYQQPTNWDRDNNKLLSCYIYIYIYCHPQTKCFLVSQLISAIRHVRYFKLRLKPAKLYVSLITYLRAISSLCMTKGGNLLSFFA